MHSRSFSLREASSTNRIRSLRLPCNLSSLWPDTRQETKPAKVAGVGSAGVGQIPGNSIRLPAQVQVRYLHLFFERLFTRPADQPRHAVCSSNHQSKPVHPRFVERVKLARSDKKASVSAGGNSCVRAFPIRFQGGPGDSYSKCVIRR